MKENQEPTDFLNSAVMLLSGLVGVPVTIDLRIQFAQACALVAIAQELRHAREWAEYTPTFNEGPGSFDEWSSRQRKPTVGPPCTP